MMISLKEGNVQPMVNTISSQLLSSGQKS